MNPWKKVFDYIKNDFDNDKKQKKEEENSKVMKNQFEIFLEEINKLKDTQIQTINNNNNEINKLKNHLPGNFHP